MIASPLNSCLQPALRRQRRGQLARALALAWTLVAVLGLALLLFQRETGWSSLATLPLLALLAVMTTLFLLVGHARTEPDWRKLAGTIEARHPELDGLLLTAVQQEAAADGRLGYLQGRVVAQAVRCGEDGDWSKAIPLSRLVLGTAAMLVAGTFLGTVLWGLRAHEIIAPPRVARLAPGVTVTPGDTLLERGSRLVVMARFTGPVPAGVELVVQPAHGTNQSRALVKALNDPMFGGSVTEVDSELMYHLEYDGQRTRDFKVGVFEHPRLERSDVDLTFPEYTGRSAQRIEDTRRVSAVEGSRLDLTLQFNKPVVQADLVAKDKAQTVLPLAVETNRAQAGLRQLPLSASATYDLRLVDAEGRTNKVPARFVFNVLKNRVPELRITSPRGDTRPSLLEEVSFDGTVWDDFGVEAYGLAYMRAGQTPAFVELGRAVPAKEKRPYHHLLRLEELELQVDHLLVWYIWADDRGPDGQLRRTTGDLFFAEIRPFDEIFREGQGGSGQGSQPGQPGESGQEEGTSSARLVELQKQIISATWKLQREHGERSPAAAAAQTEPDEAYAKDAAVVRDAQAEALAQAEAGREQVQDVRMAGALTEATEAMQTALARLREATHSPAPLPDALTAEQTAYQALLKLQQREYEVARRQQNSQRSQQSNSRQQQMQRQLDQLELTQEENRYETERQAQAPQSAERREQLQVMNRLRELAQRQEDLNARLQELQTALQEAPTEAEREEIRRELKRLQEEERQMLADLDELRQRMDRPENQSRMAEQRQQLDQAREEMQRAAEAAEQGEVSQALASGTRAQRRMQELRDEMRQASAGEFAEDLRRMRADARELSRHQEEIQQALDALNRPQRRTLDDTDDRQAVQQQLTRQQDRLTNLVERATQLSQQTEEAEPLVSRELYDTLRQFSQDEAKSVQEAQQELMDEGLLSRSLYQRLRQIGEHDPAKSLAVTSELLRQGNQPQSERAEARARAGLGQLKEGVERAAERVLGDDTEALRLARQELDALTEQVEREMARALGDGTNGQPAMAATGAGSQSDQNQRQPGQGQPPSDQPGRDPGQAQTQSRNEAETSAQAQAQNQGQGQRQGEWQDQARAGSPSDQQSQGSPSGQSGPPASANQEQRNRNGGQGQGGGRRSDQTAANSSSSADNQNQAQADRNNQTSRNGAQRNGDPNGRGTRTPFDLDDILGGPGGYGTGPITGEEFAPWSDRLREVEELVDQPELRNRVATARDQARRMRQEFKRDLKKPDWAVVRLEIVRPLVEVRQEITEELARREPQDQLVPIDRDPVPQRFSELVRRYYEELGKER